MSWYAGDSTRDGVGALAACPGRHPAIPWAGNFHVLGTWFAGDTTRDGVGDAGKTGSIPDGPTGVSTRCELPWASSCSSGARTKSIGRRILVARRLCWRYEERSWPASVCVEAKPLWLALGELEGMPRVPTQV